jgi:hypothetical protein
VDRLDVLVQLVGREARGLDGRASPIDVLLRPDEDKGFGENPASTARM